MEYRFRSKGNEIWFKFSKSKRQSIPDGLGVRIPDSHSGGPGSIPGAGVLFEFLDRSTGPIVGPTFLTLILGNSNSTWKSSEKGMKP